MCFTFKYNEVITIDEKIYKVLEYQQNLFSQKKVQVLENAPQLVVNLERSEENFASKESRKTRKKFEVEEKKKQAEGLRDNFDKYQNFYSEMFITKDEEGEKENTKKKFKVQKTESLYHDTQATAINISTM